MGRVCVPMPVSRLPRVCECVSELLAGNGAFKKETNIRGIFWPTQKNKKNADVLLSFLLFPLLALAAAARDLPWRFCAFPGPRLSAGNFSDHPVGKAILLPENSFAYKRMMKTRFPSPLSLSLILFFFFSEENATAAPSPMDKERENNELTSTSSSIRDSLVGRNLNYLPTR